MDDCTLIEFQDFFTRTFSNIHAFLLFIYFLLFFCERLFAIFYRSIDGMSFLLPQCLYKIRDVFPLSFDEIQNFSAIYWRNSRFFPVNNQQIHFAKIVKETFLPISTKIKQNIRVRFRCLYFYWKNLVQNFLLGGIFLFCTQFPKAISKPNFENLFFYFFK